MKNRFLSAAGFTANCTVSRLPVTAALVRSHCEPWGPGWLAIGVDAEAGAGAGWAIVGFAVSGVGLAAGGAAGVFAVSAGGAGCVHEASRMMATSDAVRAMIIGPYPA